MSVEVQLDGVFENEVELSKKNEVIEEKLDFVEEVLFEMERGSGDQYEFDKIETDLGQISANEEEIKADIENLKMQVQSENEVYNSLEVNLFALDGTMKDVLAEVAERRSDFRKLKVSIYEDQDKTRTSLESFNSTLGFLQENIEDLQEDFADTKTATIVLEARATKLEREMDDNYELFTGKFTDVNDKFEQIQNSSEINSKIENRFLEMLDRLDQLESVKHVSEDRVASIEENFRKRQEELLQKVEKAEEKNRRSARKIENLEMELKSLKESIERKQNEVKASDNDEKKCKLSCKEYDNVSSSSYIEQKECFIECSTKDRVLRGSNYCDSVAGSFCLKDAHCDNCGTCLANSCSRASDMKTNLIIIGGNHYSFTFDKVDLNMMKTSQLYNDNNPIAGHSQNDPLAQYCSVLVKDSVFIIGGSLIREIKSGEKTMQTHNIRNFTPHLKMHSCAAIANNFIIACCPQSRQFSMIRKCWKIIPGSNAPKTFAWDSTSHGHYSADMVSLIDEQNPSLRQPLVIAGGLKPRTDKVEINRHDGTGWRPINSLPQVASSIAMTWTKNHLFVSGGYTESRQPGVGSAPSMNIYKLQFENNKPVRDWILAGKMKLARDSHSMIAWNDGLIVFGKYETNQDRWEYFNEDASLSEFLEMPPVARKYYSFVLISPHFIL